MQWEKANFSFLRKKMFEEEVENRAVLERASQHMIIDRLVRETERQKNGWKVATRQ